MANSSPESSSGENPPIDYTFYLEMKPLPELRVAFELLADPSFNPQGYGMFGADSQGFGFGFQITNINNDTIHLQLNTASMISFRSYKPVFGKLVPFRLVYQKVPADLDGDDDIVTVFNVEGSSQLWFKFETTPPNEFPVDFMIINRTRWIPSTTIFCGVNAPTNHLRQMIDYMLQEDGHTTKKVFVCIEETFATIQMGDRAWYYFNPNELSGTSKRNPGKINWAWFEWTYTTFFYKASFLGFEFGVYFLSKPKMHIMLKFSMGELGYLAIIKKAVSMDPDINQCT